MFTYIRAVDKYVIHGVFRFRTGFETIAPGRRQGLGFDLIRSEWILPSSDPTVAGSDLWSGVDREEKIDPVEIAH